MPVCYDGSQVEFNAPKKTGGTKTVTLDVNQIASYIVGHTIMRDDYWDIIELSIHKDLEGFAEMGADDEVLPEEFLRKHDEIGYLRRAFERLKAKYGTGEEDEVNTNKQAK